MIATSFTYNFSQATNSLVETTVGTTSTTTTPFGV